MLVWKLCQQFCREKIPFTPTNKLGDGADGEVFDFVEDNNKVIKFCILFQYGNLNLDQQYINISDTLSFLKNPPASYAKVDQFIFLGKYSRPLVSCEKEQEYILYCYTMEKLNKISEDEQRIFHSILSHEDRGFDKNLSLDKIKEMLQGMSRALDFDQRKVIFFCEDLKQAPIKHKDVHVRNIMKDSSGNFKLIDFDRSELIEGNIP